MTPRSWDVFCHIIDNLGDAAVCWRLARALAGLPSRPAVRLWIDKLDVLHLLVPELKASRSWADVQVLPLAEETHFGTPADVAVDAFGGGLPEPYAEAMAARVPKSLWIVLEYLSAEAWVSTHHGLPSPHPRLPLERYFYFPGFVTQAGGLLREAELQGRRQDFLGDPRRRAALWRVAGFAPPKRVKLVTLFGYENAPVTELLDAWVHAAEPLLAAVPESIIQETVSRFMGASADSARSAQRGALEVRFLPFLSQQHYDELLWLADWNFVRGEDSFVRAQWAERPFVWQLYPQAGDAHVAKLEAFLELYCAGLEPSLAEALRTLFRAWNRAPGSKPAELASAWASVCQGGETLRCHAARWAGQAAASGDLAMNLAKFCSERLK